MKYGSKIMLGLAIYIFIAAGIMLYLDQLLLAGVFAVIAALNIGWAFFFRNTKNFTKPTDESTEK